MKVSLRDGVDVLDTLAQGESLSEAGCMSLLLGQNYHPVITNVTVYERRTSSRIWNPDIDDAQPDALTG